MQYLGLQWHISRMGLVCYPLTFRPSLSPWSESLDKPLILAWTSILYVEQLRLVCTVCRSELEEQREQARPIRREAFNNARTILMTAI